MLAVYLGAVGVKNSRYILPACLLGDLAGYAGAQDTKKKKVALPPDSLYALKPAKRCLHLRNQHQCAGARGLSSKIKRYIITQTANHHMAILER